MAEDLIQLRREAVRAVVAASQLCVAVQAQLVSSDSIAKKDSSPVTVADYAAQVPLPPSHSHSHSMSEALVTETLSSRGCVRV